MRSSPSEGIQPSRRLKETLSEAQETHDRRSDPHAPRGGDDGGRGRLAQRGAAEARRQRADALAVADLVLDKQIFEEVMRGKD